MTSRWDSEAEALADAPLTYDDLGATLRGETPAGFRPLKHTADVGPASAFDALADAIMSWDIQRGAGLKVLCAPMRVSPGAVVLLRPWLLPLVIRCRVVAMVDEPHRRGFVYGTLPGHPLQGEEAFLAVRVGDRVEYHARAFSRPVNPFARLGAPVTFALQRYANRRYERAARSVASSA